MPIELTKDNLDSVIQDNKIVLIDFWAEWCGPCKMFGPVFEKVSERHPDVTFAKADTEAEQEVAASFGIRSIPTVAVFRDQVLLFMQPGTLSEEGLEEIIEKVKGLDMAEVRAEIEKTEKDKSS